MSNVGKVWLVGAGPGDVGLFTLKGQKILKEAEVVVYDSLVGDGILAMVPEGVKLINVGKRAGNHIMRQEGINQVLLDEALEGKRVVRLKGGDPFLFGRGGEELELLSEHNVPYEVVPGITSCIAVPAYNGIPVTHRDYVSSVHVITGHKKAGTEYNINFKALVETKGTLVFLMGVTALEDICNNLMAAGMDPNMPAAILQQGTTAGQKKIVATVSTLKAEVDRQGIKTPAIIVVGGVCEVADKFGWYEKQPLFGNKIVVTRPAELNSVMAEKLRKQGAEVIEIPAISVKEVEDTSEVMKAIGELETYDWITFTSPSGVRIFFDLLKKSGKDIRALGNVKIASIGGGTTKALAGYQLNADLMPETYDGVSLGKEMAEKLAPNAKVLLARASIGNRGIIEELNKRADITVTDLATYDTVYVKQEIIDEIAAFESGSVDYAVFTSASTVKGFVAATEGLDYTAVQAICIGKQTEEEALKHGMKTFVSKKASMDSIVELLIELNQ